MREIRNELQDEALAEEFIEGREVYVGVDRPRRAAGDPARSSSWTSELGQEQADVSDREVKFGPETEGSPRLVIAKDISDELRARIERAALLAYRALKLQDYARIDFRISEHRRARTCSRRTPTRTSRRQASWRWGLTRRACPSPQLVGRILESAAKRYGLLTKAEKAEKAPPAAKAEPVTPPTANVGS